jgi:preprotein translocase subunit Sss1
MASTTRLPHPVRGAAMAVAVVFLLVGVLGFVPGLTSDLDRIAFAGPESGAHLLGVFHVSVLHNLVHLLFGAVGFAMARSASTARAFLLGGGLIYLVLWLYGLIVDKASAANFVPVNDADDWLHLGLGLGMVALALALKGNPAARSA